VRAIEKGCGGGGVDGRIFVRVQLTKRQTTRGKRDEEERVS